MPQFLVELEDGRKFNVESDIAPTDDDINDFLNQGAPPAPVSDDAFQSPMETGTRAAGLSFATGPYATMAAIGTVRDEISGFIGDTAAGIPRRVFDALSVVPRTLAPLARDVVEQNQEAIAPDSRTNPKAATVGGVIGDIPNLVVSGLVNPAIPLMQGGVRGFDAGIDQANEMGLESPAQRIALGTAFGGVEALIEKAGGIGSKAAKDAVLSAAKRTLGQNLVKLGKSTGVEAGEELVTGAAQDSLSANFAPNTYDTAPLNPLTPDLTVNPEWLARRGYDALGGAVGGVGFGLTYLGAERFKPTPTLAPVADPLAAAAASFPTPPPPSPPTAQVSPPPLPTQPPAPAATATAPTQTWNVELDDGRQFVVESDTQPTAADIEDFLATPPPSASVNAAIPPVPQRGPATVDEGIVGSTPAAGALSPSPSPQVPQFSPSSVPLATRKVPVIEDAPYGGRDVLDFVNDNPIVIPQIAIGGDMDWAEKAGLPKTYAKFLTLPGDTGNINEVAQDAYDLNIISEPTPDALMAEIQKTIESRESYKADAKSQQSQMSQAEKARVLFDKAVTRAAKAKTGTQRVPIDSMNKGDTITLGGETMTVVAQDVNDDGFNNSVTLRSESGRLGTVTLDAATTADLAVEGFEKAPPPEDTSGTWADDVIRGSMETPFIGIDPVLMAAYTVKGAQLIREGFTTFAKWSAEMLRRFGDKVRNYLQDVWMAVQKNSQAGGSLPRGERPAKQNPGNLSATGAMISSPKADAVLPAFESLDSFQSAPERPATTEDYNTYVGRQEEKLREAKLALSAAKQSLETGIQINEMEREAREIALSNAGMSDDGNFKGSVDLIVKQDAVKRAQALVRRIERSIPAERLKRAKLEYDSALQFMLGAENAERLNNVNYSNNDVKSAYNSIPDSATQPPPPGVEFAYRGRRARTSDDGQWIQHQQLNYSLPNGPGYEWINSDPISWYNTPAKIAILMEMARERYAAASAELYLAQETEGGTTDRLAAKRAVMARTPRQHEADMIALLDERDEEAKNAGAAHLANVWKQIASREESFQFGKTTSKSAEKIAEAVSIPRSTVTADDNGHTVRFATPKGYLEIHKANTATPFIQSEDADSKGTKQGGGSQIYQAALDWIHNNGKTIRDDPRGITSINNVRRTSNFLSNALRWGTTAHLKPHKKQNVKGWVKGKHLRNIAALASREMENAFEVIALARQWTYDFNLDKFADATGNEITQADFDAAVDAANPQESGIGFSTLERAVVTHSALQEFQRGQSAEALSEGIKSNGALDGILYFDATGLVFVSDVLTTMARQARDLAAFSTRAINQFGTWIKPHLENLWKLARQSQEATLAYLESAWQAATTRTMPRMGGGRVTVRRPEGGFIQPGSPSPADPAEVKLTQDTIAAEREAAGGDALPTGGQFTVEQLTADARAEVQKPGRVQAILDDILAQQRPATPLEHYTLLNFKGQLDAELAQAEGILSDPATTEDDRGDAAARKREADAMKDKLEVVAQISGSRAGAALGVRRFGLDREDIPTLNKMVADITIIMDPTGRTPLPPEERAKIEEMHKTIIDTKAAADTQQEEGVGGAKNTFNLELEKLLKEAQAQIAAQEAALKQAALDLTNAAKPRPQAIKDKGILKAVADRGAMARERLRAKGFFGGTTNVGIDPSIILDLAEAGMGFLAEGADFTIRMVQEFGEKIRPFLGQIRDKSEQLLRGETQKKTVSDVKSKAQETVRRTGKAPDNLARQFALAHIIDHLERQDPTLTAEKIAKLVADDLQEFFPGIQVRQARDLISGYGKSTQPSKEEARVALRDLSAQMQKLTQLEALLKKEPLLKSGPQRQEPSARLRELQKQVEQLKKDTGYTGRSREDELKSIRDRIQKTLENQIEELQRVLAGQGTPTAPRQRQVYDANLQALQTLRNSLKVLVAELPQHRLASELRRNTAAEAAAKASETEYNRRIKAKEWKAQGKIQGPQTQAVTEARAAAAAARQQFLDLKRAAQPNFDPNAKELAAFKKRIQGQIDKLNERIAKGEFDPVKRTPRQIKHDADSAKLLTELNKAKRAFIDAKVAARLAKMGWVDKGIEKLRTLLITARSLMTGGEFSGIGRQGLLTALSRPALFAGNLKQMKEAFKSEQNETAIFDRLWKRPNAINGLYKRAKLALHDPDDYSDLMAEGAARSKLANKIPWFSHTGRAYSTLLADMRAELFDMLVAKYEKRTKAPIGDRAAEALAEFVNDSTGSGKLGFGKRELKGSAKDFLGLGIFSPAFVASRARLLVAASLWQGDMQSRLLIAEEYIRITAGMTALIALAAALQGDDEEEMELDPRGGGFMKMQFGATSVDLMAGLNSMATFLIRSAPFIGGVKAKDGTIKPIRGEDVPMGQSWLDIAVRFGRNKLSPGASFVVNRLTGTDPMGRPQTALQGMQQAITPITFGAAWDAAMEEPLNRSAALVPAAFLGVSTSTKRPEGASFFKDLQRMGERLTGFNP